MTPSPVDQLVSINSQIMQYIEVLLALGGVLALAYVVLRIGLPRVMGVRSSTGGPIQIVARCALAPKHTLHLIKVGSQMSLIATWDNGVTLLTAMTAENADNLGTQRTTNTAPIDVSSLPWRRKSEKER